MKTSILLKGQILTVFLLCFVHASYSQYPTSCTGIGSRTNGNGQTNSCPNVSGTPYASNFVGTTFATVPTGAKTGTLVFRFAGATASLKPFAITAVWSTNPTTTQIAVDLGPASVPVVVGSDVEVTYCFYGTNLPNAGTLSFRFTNPETGAHFNICSYPANCASSCVTVSNPTGLTLPVLLQSFKAVQKNGTVQLFWNTAQENNNKGFTIEKSTDGANYSSIDFIDSKNINGNSSVSTDYFFTDNKTDKNKNIWYRLRQEDLDGKYYFSAVILVTLATNKNNVIVYADLGKIIISGIHTANKKYQLIVVDAFGRKIHEEKVLTLGAPITVQGLARGAYFVQLTAGDGGKLVYPVIIK